MRARCERPAELLRRIAVSTVALAVALSLGACGRLNRTATIGSAATGPTVAGALVAAELQRELAASVASSGRVTCVHRMLVHVGTTSTCSYTRAGHTEVVTFRFADTSGAVAAGSVSTR